MKNKITMLALLLVSSAFASTAYTVPVTCKEFPPNTFTAPLTVTIDGSTISAGGASDHCQFSLTGPVLVEPFAPGSYSFTDAGDLVCWHTGGFCVAGPQLVRMDISTPPTGGAEFTIVSASITTTFTLPTGGGGDTAVPEPGTWLMLAAGLLALGYRSRS